MKRKTNIAIIFAVLSLGSFAEDAATIIARVDEKNKSMSSKMTMIMQIKPADGSAVREFSLDSRENADGDSFIEFIAPKTVKGMRILSRDDSSWVFFPSTGRVRKIGSSSRGGSVQGIGGDFSYDDLGGDDWSSDYTFTVLSESDVSWLLEGKRKTGDAAYDSVKLAIEKKTYRTLVGDFALDKEGGYFKKLELSEYRDFGAAERATKMVMTNEKKGSSTIVTIPSAEFGVTVEEKLFDPARFAQ